MKTDYRSSIPNSRKSKGQKALKKRLSMSTIAQRYLEVQRLREMCKASRATVRVESAMRTIAFRSLYVAAITVATVGWAWSLLEGVRWVVGV